MLVDEEHRNTASRGAVGRNREAISAEPIALAAALHLAFEQGVAEPGRRAKPLGIELGSQPRQIPLCELQFLVPGAKGVVAEPVVILPGAQARQRFRAQGGLRIESGIEKREQARILLRNGLLRRASFG